MASSGSTWYCELCEVHVWQADRAEAVEGAGYVASGWSKSRSHGAGSGVERRTHMQRGELGSFPPQLPPKHRRRTTVKGAYVYVYAHRSTRPRKVQCPQQCPYPPAQPGHLRQRLLRRGLAGDATLRHETNVSHQRIHELKHVLEDAGELVIVERPGYTNLYFVAWQGKPLGGTFPETGRHDPFARCGTRPPPRRREGSEIILTPPCEEEVSDISEAQGSEMSEGRGQKNLTRKQEKTREENKAPVATAPTEDESRGPQPLLVS